MSFTGLSGQGSQRRHTPRNSLGEKYKSYAPEGYSKGKITNWEPEQYEMFQQRIGELGPDSYLARLAGGDQSLFGEIEAPALKQFGALQGNIASRFSGPGGGGSQNALSARRSSGFQNTQTQAAQDFASQLQSQRQGLQRQAILDLQGLSNQLLYQQPYDKMVTEKPKPWYQEAATGAIQGFAHGAGQAVFGG